MLYPPQNVDQGARARPRSLGEGPEFDSAGNLVCPSSNFFKENTWLVVGLGALLVGSFYLQYKAVTAAERFVDRR